MIVNFTEYLAEMAIKLSELDTRDRTLIIQIRTGSNDGGPSEHPPPHIHVLHRKTELDVPISIATGEPLKRHGRIKGTLSPDEKRDVLWFLRYYGKAELTKIFNDALAGHDPGPAFQELEARRHRENRPDPLEERMFENVKPAPLVTLVKPTGNEHELFIEFEDGVSGTISFSREYLDRPWPKPLLDPSYFALVSINEADYTIEWPNTFGLCAFEFYDELKENQTCHYR